MRYGRNIWHAPESLQHPYSVPAPGLHTVLWQHYGPVLDQGDLGSCTGNAMEQCLATGPLFRPGFIPTEAQAVQIYSAATHLDRAKGVYPPTDTGSSGLAVAKAAKKMGLISAYKHVFGLAHAKATIQTTPFIVGTEFTDDMESPDASGFVRPTGKVAGGHEYLCLGYNVETQVWSFLNSWSDTWGIKGVFYMHDADFGILLANQGDITVPMPL